MRISCNRSLDVSPNILSVDSESENKSATLKIRIPDDFAKAIMHDWMALDVGKTPSLENVQIVWTDKGGLTFSHTGNSLADELKEDIRRRYDNPEYYDDYLVHEDSAQETLTDNILGRYNNSEYWEKDIAREYLSNDYISDDDAGYIRILLSDREIAEMLLSEKSNP